MLHLMKLAVGVADTAQLRHAQAHRVTHDPPLRHLTRHMPRRGVEVLGGGSLYWVIGGAMLVRQAILGLEPWQRADGTPCAAILLHPALVVLAGRPVKAFQGWRYLKAEDAPADLDPGSAEAALPPAMAQRLRELCLL